ncbi:MAG: endonuclease [bacterium]|nr:endonuclease [bacterium]
MNLKTQVNYLKAVCTLTLLLIASNAFPQYYASINTSSPAFVTDLETRIRVPYVRISYDNFDETNIANFASINNGNGTRSVFCVYSGYEYIYTGTFSWGTMSREHTFAHSWMPTFPSTSNDQYADQHHLFPTHQNNANGRRSNHPLGVVINITYQFLEGKVGTNANGNIVYEPRDLHKGDAARALLYMMLRYDSIGGNTWNLNWLNNTKLPALGEGPQELSTLLNWHNQDPPDKWEVDRNNYVQSIQQNRNPFVDHPEYVNYINFNSITKLNPPYSSEPTNYVTGFGATANATSIQLNWNDATGAQLPSGYLIIAYNRNSYFLPIDGATYANDTSLADGFGIMNVPYSGPNTFSFNNLTAGSTYYFSVFSYNGSGALTNYKIDGTFPQSNATVAPILVTEPTNYVTNFTSSNITTNSLQLNWTDALPGSQVPSGYLLVGNNSNIFTNPVDGTSYANDVNLSDGEAVVNIAYNAPDSYSFTSLFTGTNYYFKIYSYNGSGGMINYKTNPVTPFVNAMTTGSGISTTVLLDNFNRSNNSSLGNTLPPEVLSWQESETVIPTSININGSRSKLASTTSGREFAYVNIGSVNGYPSQFGSSGGLLTWALNIRQSRLDPSGFDGNNYGAAFILGKTTTDIATGNGYAVVLGQSGSGDPVRLAKFTNGINANSRFTNVISGGDYANEYLSIKVTFDPSTNGWSLYVDSSPTAFVQSDPRNTTNQLGLAPDSTYTETPLPYLGTLWNHATGASDSLVFDDMYVPSPPSSTTINVTAIFEGVFETGAATLNIKDTSRVYLRNSGSPYNIVDSAKAVIDSVNFTGSFNFVNAVSGNYYIVITNRNSIETWSSSPQAVTQGSPSLYNFTISITQAYGENLVFRNSKFCIYSGDVNQDGSVDVTDILLVYNDASNFTEGYVSTDINGDNFVDITDQIIAYNNSSNFVSKITPQ